MSREFLPGQVIAYPYLWAWQQERGETEGRKVRPTCVVVAVRGANDGLTHLALLAITTQPPQRGRVARDSPAGASIVWIDHRRRGMRLPTRLGFGHLCRGRMEPCVEGEGFL